MSFITVSEQGTNEFMNITMSGAHIQRVVRSFVANICVKYHTTQKAEILNRMLQ